MEFVLSCGLCLPVLFVYLDSLDTYGMCRRQLWDNAFSIWHLAISEVAWSRLCLHACRVFTVCSASDFALLCRDCSSYFLAWLRFRRKIERNYQIDIFDESSFLMCSSSARSNSYDHVWSKYWDLTCIRTIIRKVCRKHVLRKNRSAGIKEREVSK